MKLKNRKSLRTRWWGWINRIRQTSRGDKGIINYWSCSIFESSGKVKALCTRYCSQFHCLCFVWFSWFLFWVILRFSSSSCWRWWSQASSSTWKTMKRRAPSSSGPRSFCALKWPTSWQNIWSAASRSRLSLNMSTRKSGPYCLALVQNSNWDITRTRWTCLTICFHSIIASSSSWWWPSSQGIWESQGWLSRRLRARLQDRGVDLVVEQLDGKDLGIEWLTTRRRDGIQEVPMAMAMMTCWLCWMMTTWASRMWGRRGQEEASGTTNLRIISISIKI